MFLVERLGLFHVQNGSHAQPERRPRHQVCDDALVRLAFVDLPELFLVVYFDTDAVLQNVLDVLLADHCQAVFICRSDHLLKVRWMAPGNLDRG